MTTAMYLAVAGTVLAFLTAGALLFSTYLSHRDNTREHEELQTQIQTVKTDLQTEIQTARTDLQTEIQTARTDLQTEIQTARTDLQTEMQAGFDRLSAQIAGLRDDGEPADD